MTNFISTLKLLYAIYVYLKDPNQVDSVLKMGNALLPKNSENLNRNVYLSNPSFLAMVQARYGLEKIQYSEESATSDKELTLGRAYVYFIKTNHLNERFYESQTQTHITSDQEYIVFRIRQTHDFWHIATGYTTSQEDEAGLIAFYYAQLRSPLSALIAGLSFLHFLRKRPQDLPSLFEKITSGWERGLKAKPLISYKWEENLNKPLVQVQEELGLLPSAT